MSGTCTPIHFPENLKGNVSYALPFFYDVSTLSIMVLFLSVKPNHYIISFYPVVKTFGKA